MINMIVTWWHRRRFRKIAIQAMGLLVTGGTPPIEIKRFKKDERRKALTISIIKDEPMKATVLQSSQHAIRSVSSDSKTPGYVRHTEFNEHGESIADTYVELKKP